MALSLGLGALCVGFLQIVGQDGASQATAERSVGDWSQIRPVISVDRYRPVPDADGGLTATNPANGFLVSFGEDGFSLASESDGWHLPVRFAEHGWSGRMTAAETVDPVVSGERVEFRRDTVTEWYVNRATGVEQGFTVTQAPEGPGRILDVTLEIGGGFTARPDGRDAVLVHAQTGTEIAYDTLVVVDARGRILPSHMAVSDRRIVLSVDTLGAAFPIVIDPTFTQQSKLLADNKANADQFGFSVSISGETALVGAPGEDDTGTTDSGAAYVFTHSGGVWSQQALLRAGDKGSGDNFGYAVAISGDTAVIGAYLHDGLSTANSGAAYVFVRSGATWTLQAKLVADDADTADAFGSSVAIAGDTIVVGATGESSGSSAGNGAAYVFTRSGAVWTQQAKLVADDRASTDRFGRSVAVSGDTVLIGANFEDDGVTLNNGAAYVFTRSSEIWTQQQKLLALDRATDDEFGRSVALSGDTALVGAFAEDDGATSGNGAAYVFTRSGTTWSQQQKLLAADGADFDAFGFTVSLSGDHALVGAHLEDDGVTANTGAAYLFTRSGGIWSQQQKLLAGDEAGEDLFGYSVALSGNIALIGAVQEDDSGTTDNGAAYALMAAPPTPVPTVSEWALILFGLMLASGAIAMLQRRRMMA